MNLFKFVGNFKSSLEDFPMSAIVTLTTDLGTRDYYLGAIKGSILGKRSWINTVDISHDVNPYDIVQAAFILKNAYKSFPKETIHIVWVSNASKNDTGCLIIEHDGYFFVGPDNGVFSLMFDPLPVNMVFVEFKDKGTFTMGDIIPHAIDQIVSKKPLAEMGRKVNSITTRFALQPVTNKAQIRGSVIHIDHYENVIVNINRDLFEKIRNGRNFAVYFKRNDPLKSLSSHYSEVPVGETLCLFNSAGYLEISINMGRAASLLGMEVDDTVQIEFE